MATARKKKAQAEEHVWVPAIKGFDAKMQCRGYQFNHGETYNHDGEVKACKGGFHAITGHPLAVFDYYPPAGSRFCMVELAGDQHSDDDTKTAARILKVGREIGISDLVNEAIKWVLERSHPEGAASATGTQGAASATGYQGAASATGTQGAAMTSGWEGRVMGAIGNALFACERETWNGPIISVACGIVGQDGIKPDRWYMAKSGRLVAVSAERAS